MELISVEELNKIVELANSVPEQYRLKCFELLLGNTLQTTHSPASIIPPSAPSPVLPPSPTPDAQPFVLPIDVKAFLSQYKLDESLLWRYFLVVGSEVRPIYHLQATKKATAQIHHALMMCLENALITGQFQVELEALRTRCNEQKCYDKANFAKNVKDNASLFKTIVNDQPLVLAADGKSELADLLEQLKA